MEKVIGVILQLPTPYVVYSVIVAMLVLILFIAVTWYTAHVSAEPGERVELFFGLVAYTKNVPVTSPLVTNTSTEIAGKTHKILETLGKYGVISVVGVILIISALWFTFGVPEHECDLPWQQQPLHCPLSYELMDFSSYSVV